MVCLITSSFAVLVGESIQFNTGEELSVSRINVGKVLGHRVAAHMGRHMPSYVVHDLSHIRGTDQDTIAIDASIED